jgi:hypothetical protein
MLEQTVKDRLSERIGRKLDLKPSIVMVTSIASSQAEPAFLCEPKPGDKPDRTHRNSFRSDCNPDLRRAGNIEILEVA